jgi:hypothetical protein
MLVLRTNIERWNARELYLMPHAVSDEHAVVLSLEDADVAHVAVPSTGRGHGLANHAQLPGIALKKIKSFMF